MVKHNKNVVCPTYFRYIHNVHLHIKGFLVLFFGFVFFFKHKICLIKISQLYLKR